MSKTRVLLVIAPFYRQVTEMLMAGATRQLEAAGVEIGALEVPGALEIPPAIRLVHVETTSASGNGSLQGASIRPPIFDGYVALGCVIRGETSHYEVVANQSAQGLMTLGTMGGVPVGNGILTVDNLEQALLRAHPDERDKGGAAARACLRLIEIRRTGLAP